MTTDPRNTLPKPVETRPEHADANAERDNRRNLQARADTDPESWAAIALKARAKAVESLETATPSKGMARPLRDLQLAEQLERQVLARYAKPTPKGKRAQNNPPTEAASTQEAELREQLRTEHQEEPTSEAPNTGNNGAKATTGVL